MSILRPPILSKRHPKTPNTTLTYNDIDHTLTLTKPDGTAQTFPANNNVDSTSEGHWPAGTYNYVGSVTHDDDSPNSAYGSHGGVATALKLAEKDYAGSRTAAEGVLNQKPDDVRALNLLVQGYSAQNQMAAGLQKARDLASRQPGSASVQQYLGQLLYANGDRAGARKAFEAAEAAKPDLVTGELALAELDTVEGKRAEARKRLSAVVASHPASVPGHLLFAQLEITEGKTAAAIDQFRKAVALDEKNAVALNGLAYLLAESKQPDEALKYAQKAKELAPNSAAVDDTLGWTYFQKGLYSMAVTHLEGAIAREGTARRKYHLAMAYLKAGDPKKGRLTLDAALKMDPTLPEAQTARQAFGITAN